VAYRCGSVPEIIDPGVTGWIVEDEHQAAATLASLDGFDRAACRKRFEQRFTAERMARDYVRVYRRLAADGSLPDLQADAA